MAYIDFMSIIHNKTKRDYLARVNDVDFPKYKAADLAKKWGFDYWDGDRRVCYGGYNYIEGRWAPVAKQMIKHYGLKPKDKVLDIGCGKGFQLYEIKKECMGIEVYGVDVSSYAIANSKIEVKSQLTLANATELPFEDNYFDYVYSINTLHNLPCFELEKALSEIQRVSKGNSYICIESYRTEKEKANLLYWQVTCEAFNTPKEWEWWFSRTGYTGDHSFIFFE